jgi:hypothetical protein
MLLALTAAGDRRSGAGAPDRMDLGIGRIRGARGCLVVPGRGRPEPGRRDLRALLPQHSRRPPSWRYPGFPDSFFCVLSVGGSAIGTRVLNGLVVRIRRGLRTLVNDQSISTKRSRTEAPSSILVSIVDCVSVHMSSVCRFVYRPGRLPLCCSCSPSTMMGSACAVRHVCEIERR